jgi:hypothetical protein
MSFVTKRWHHSLRRRRKRKRGERKKSQFYEKSRDLSAASKNTPPAKCVETNFFFCRASLSLQPTSMSDPLPFIKTKLSWDYDWIPSSLPSFLRLLLSVCLPLTPNQLQMFGSFMPLADSWRSLKRKKTFFKFQLALCPFPGCVSAPGIGI